MTITCDLKKTCTRCKLPKSLSEFHKNRSSPDGLCHWCKVCNCEYAKTIDKRVLRERREKRRKTVRGYQREIYNNARRRARDCGVPFDLTPYAIELPPESCPCCSRLLIRKGSWENQPSLDRLIPEKGYVHDNVRWLCRRCNQVKNNASAQELIQLALYVSGLIPGGTATMRGLANRAWESETLREPVEIGGRWYAAIDWHKAFAKYGEEMDSSAPSV